MKRRPVIAVSAAVLGLGVLAGCSGADTSAPSGSSSSQAASSATDVAFAQSMIPHHEQAVEMADLALAPSSQASAQVRELATQIKAAQDPEIARMSAWLQQWGAPSAMPMDHSNHDMGAVTMSGMMTADQMAALTAVSGDDFDRMWMQMMIEHHEGAVTMAEQVQQASTDPQVTGLADDIVAAQRQEIATMQELLGQDQ